MGRPRKEEHERRIASVRADLTEAEKVFVQDQAAKAGLSEAEYTRRRVLGNPVESAATDRRIEPALLSELNRIGVNVNQIARHLNAGRTERGSLDVVVAELRGVLGQLLQRPEH